MFGNSSGRSNRQLAAYFGLTLGLRLVFASDVKAVLSPTRHFGTEARGLG
jgi:hypothetical protein